MTNKTFITSRNISTFAKVQNSRSYGERGEIVLVWDDLSRKQKNLAKNIDIDELVIRTNNPKSVPNKWEDKIQEEDKEIGEIDLIKHIIANPARYEVYELLKDANPSEPLMLWWIDKCFKDPDYFKMLAEACKYNLFCGDVKYLWASIAFGTESGKGSFRWPSSDKEPKEVKSIKKKILDKYDIRKKELNLMLDDIKTQCGDWVDLTDTEADYLGIELTDDETEEEAGAKSLLDF